MSHNLLFSRYKRASVVGDQGEGRNGWLRALVVATATAGVNQNASLAGRPFNDSFYQNMPLERRVIVWKHAL